MLSKPLVLYIDFQPELSWFQMKIKKKIQLTKATTTKQTDTIPCSGPNFIFICKRHVKC